MPEAVSSMLPLINLGLLLVSLVVLVVVLKKSSGSRFDTVLDRFDQFDKSLGRTDQTLRQESAQSRAEQTALAREQRFELQEAFRGLSETVGQRIADASGIQRTQLAAFAELLESFARENAERLELMRRESAAGGKQLREEVVATLNGISDVLNNTLAAVTSAQEARFEGFAKELSAFRQASTDRVDAARQESVLGGKALREEVITTLKGLSEALSMTLSSVATSQETRLEGFAKELTIFRQSTSDRLDAARQESAIGAKELRQEVVDTLNRISETMATTMKDLAAAEKTQLDHFSTQISSLTKTTSEKLDGIRAESSESAKQLRQEVAANLESVSTSTRHTMGEIAQLQKTQLETMTTAIAKLSEMNEQRLEALRATVEGRLQIMQTDNAKQLDQMRQTVDEKLQSTLEKRLGESFQQVSERLELVHRGLGEMQSLATGVGDLKKVLSNVKTRGTWGEVQLGALLEQVLNPDQFAANVATAGGAERVEFAIKLPGQGTDRDETVWLPIDAKFPIEDYQRLLEAQDQADLEAVESAGKQLELRIKASAKNIGKYLNPPGTTDFAILFLPIEGLFAEVIRRPGLAEVIQRDHRVVIAGPTTLWSILNSLQMGFRTLAIQKRSSEVWNLLGAVKTEWLKYGAVMDAVKEKLEQASKKIDQVQTRSRAVGRKLRAVQELPVAEASALLPMDALGEDMEEEVGMTSAN